MEPSVVMVANALPYQQEPFADFLAFLGRCFYDDPTIVLLDFFAREQLAFTETDLRDRLKWRENLIQQKLYTLERHYVLERTIGAERGSKSLQIWRINPKVCLAIEYRVKAALQAIHDEMKEVSVQSQFLCPDCKNTYDVLDAVSGPTALEDQHPLCRTCGTRLTRANSEEARVQIESKLRRAEQAFEKLRTRLARVKGMTIPQFTPEGIITSTSMNQEEQPADTTPAAPTATNIFPDTTTDRAPGAVTAPSQVSSVTAPTTFGSLARAKAVAPTKLRLQAGGILTLKAPPGGLPQSTASRPPTTRPSTTAGFIPTAGSVSSVESSSTLLTKMKPLRISLGKLSTTGGNNAGGSGSSSATAPAARLDSLSAFGKRAQPTPSLASAFSKKVKLQ